jgi:hypothetical protein
MERTTYRLFDMSVLRLNFRHCLAVAIMVGAATYGVAGCARVKSPREQVVGIWQFTGMHSTGRVVYRSDGTMVALTAESDDARPVWVPSSVGKWWLEDHTLVTDVEIFIIGGTTRRVTRSVIASFDDDRLVSGDGHSDSIRVTPIVARWSQVALVLRGIAGLLALGAAIYGASRSHRRWMYLLLGAGGVCMLLACGFGLPEEFAQTGDWLISWSSMEALRLPRDIFQSVAAILFVGAFVWLVFSIRRSKTQQ